MQVIATANARLVVTVLALVVVAVLTVLIVWLPLLAYLAFPDVPTRAPADRERVAPRERPDAGGRRPRGGGVLLVVNGALGI